MGADGRGRRDVHGGGRVPKWAPDGRAIAYFEGGGLSLIDPQGRSPRVLVPDVGDYADFAWSPDSRSVAFAVDLDGDAGQLDVIGADGTGRRRIAEGSSISEVSWAPDAGALAFVDGDHAFVVDRNGSGLVPLMPSVAASEWSLDWSPDGARLAVAADGDIAVVDRASRGRRKITDGVRRGYSSTSPHWDPRGRRTRVLAGRFVAPDVPPRSRLAGRTLRAQGEIVAIAADRSRLALVLSEATACDHVETWDVARGTRGGYLTASNCPGGEAGGVGDVALAGDAVVWLDYMETNHLTYAIELARPTAPRAVDVERVSDVGELGSLVGRGGTVVYGAWSIGGRAEGFRPKNGKIRWLVGGRPRTIRSSAAQLRPLAVGDGEIAVARADQAVDVIRVDGKLVRSYPTGRRFAGAGFSGPRVVLLRRGRLEVYEPGSEHVAAARRAVPDATLLDVDGDLAVYAARRVVHVVRLSDGRERVFMPPGRGPVLAQLESAGLWYAYEVSGREKGRVTFVPRRALR